MSRHQQFKIKPLQSVNGFGKPMFVGLPQMHSPQHCTNGFAAHKRLHVFDSIDHSRVGASQNHRQAASQINDQSLIVPQRIGLRTGGTQEERPASILEIVSTRHFTCDLKAVRDLRWGGGLNQPTRMLMKLAAPASMPMKRAVPSMPQPYLAARASG